MEKYKYKALNSKGRPIKGVLGAVNENDLFNQLQSANLELVSCVALSSKKSKSRLVNRIKIRDLIQLFIHLDQMDGAGVPLLDALADIRDTTENTALRDAMSEIHRDVSEGSQLSEAMAKHLAEESKTGPDPSTIKGDQTVTRMIATGVEVLD